MRHFSGHTFLPRIDDSRACARLLIVAVLCALMAGAVQARGFRTMVSFSAADDSTTPADAQPLAPGSEIPRSVAVESLTRIVAQWNTPAMQAALSERFFDAAKFGDNLAENLPRDATLRIQAIRGVQTLSQRTEQDSVTGAVNNVSIVSVTAQTQLEFSSTSQGFVRRSGVNEFILEITEAIP